MDDPERSETPVPKATVKSPEDAASTGSVHLNAKDLTTSPPHIGTSSVLSGASLSDATLLAEGVVGGTETLDGEGRPLRVAPPTAGTAVFLIENVAETAGAGEVSTASVVPPPAPPNVPSPRSAAIWPVWIDGKLTVAPEIARTVAPEQQVLIALRAAKAKLDEVTATLRREPGNVDGRLIKFVERVAKLVPLSPPDQFALFIFGQEVDALKMRVELAARDGELPIEYEADLRTAVVQLSDCALQFEAWRQFKANVQTASLRREQIAIAPQIAHQLADHFASEHALEHIDESVPRALRALADAAHEFPADDPSGAISEGNALLANDIIESISNLFKALASNALRVWQAFNKAARDGAEAEASKVGDKFGRGIVRWTYRLLLTIPTLSALAPFSPQLSWIMEFERYWNVVKPFLE